MQRTERHHAARRLGLIALLALGLSACFISRGDLITPAEADYPLPHGTQIAIYSLDENGARRNQAPDLATLVREGDYYQLTMEGEPPVTGLIDHMGGDLYIAMARDDEQPGQNLYALFVRDGSVWHRHGLICSDFEEIAAAQGKTLDEFGIKEAGGDCLFDKYDDLKRAMQFESQHGAPDADYVVVE